MLFLYILYIQTETSLSERFFWWKIKFPEAIIFFFEGILNEAFCSICFISPFYLLNTQIGHALVHHKIGFFKFVVCLFSYLDRGFWSIYVSHDVLLSRSFLIPPQSIMKDELRTETLALRRARAKKESHSNSEWYSLMQRRENQPAFLHLSMSDFSCSVKYLFFLCHLFGIE